MGVEVVTVSLEDPRARELTAAMREELRPVWEGREGSSTPVTADDFAAPGGAFVVALLDGRAVGCAGLCRSDPTTGQLRRMYVSPDARGAGVGGRILDALLEIARERGYTHVRLATGCDQTAPIRLARRAGFAPIPCWGTYAEDESCCFGLEL